jgi:hypothetical protein
MRFALLLSGLQRNNKPFIENQLNCIIKNNDCDVFIFTSDENNNRHFNNNQIIHSQSRRFKQNGEYYKKKYGKYLKKVTIDYENNLFNKYVSKYFKKTGNTFHHNLLSANFKIKSVIEMMEKHELDNLIKYDVVVRARLDYFMLKPINLKKLNSKYGYLSIDYKSGHIDDVGIIVNRQNLKYLKSFIEIIKNKYYEIDNMFVEQELYKHLENNINIKTIKNLFSRVGFPLTLRYNLVPFLTKSSFRELTSKEYYLSWNNISGYYKNEESKIIILLKMIREVLWTFTFIIYYI